MKSYLKQNRAVVNLSLLAYGLLLTIVWFTPVAFSGYLKVDSSARWWYLLSESGGVVGSAVILSTTSLVVALSYDTITAKLKQFTLILIGFVCLLASCAFLNEYVIKHLIKKERPSHAYLSKNAKDILPDITEFYLRDEKARTLFLEDRLKLYESEVADIYPPVLKHWIKESGYSFPSGHSENSFLLATLIALLIYNYNAAYKFYAFIPYLWAVAVCSSRVAIGVHSAFDVSLGALAGILIATLIGVLNLHKYIIPQKRQTKSANT